MKLTFDEMQAASFIYYGNKHATKFNNQEGPLNDMWETCLGVFENKEDYWTGNTFLKDRLPDNIIRTLIRKDILYKIEYNAFNANNYLAVRMTVHLNTKKLLDIKEFRIQIALGTLEGG